jgi:iron complex outermembrane recepter protein
MKKMNLLGSSALGSIAVIGALAFAAPVYAQSPTPVVPGDDPCLAPAEQRDAANCPDDGARETQPLASQGIPAGTQEGIVVVGSRIRRNVFNTADPVQIITRDDAVQSGFASTAQLLQSTAVTGGSNQIGEVQATGFVVAGGAGTNTISLRGLGASRTLVLLNGRRIAPAGSRGQVGSADLNSLPSAILERVEILNTGASSIYGSDAIAGVVNLVTRSNVRGLTLEAQHNIDERGDGNSRRYSAVFGERLGRLNFAGSLEWYKRDPVRWADREYTRCPIRGHRSAPGEPIGSGDFIDPLTGESKCFPLNLTGEPGGTWNTIATPNIPVGQYVGAPGVPATAGACNRFQYNPSVTTGALPGYMCVGGTGIDLNVRQTFAPELLNHTIIPPAETYQGFLQANYETGMLGNADLYTEILVSRRNSEQTGSRQINLDYPVGSPQLPANLIFAAPALPAQPNGTTNGEPIAIRVFGMGGNITNTQQVDFARVGGGLRGDLLGDFRYNSWFGQTWTDSDYTLPGFALNRLAQANDLVVSSAGVVSCRNTTGGCVPMPFLTPEIIAGQLPQNFRNFIYTEGRGSTSYRETNASFTVDGPLFNLPGGPLGIATGVEWRRYSIDDTPSFDTQTTNVQNLTSSTITRGSDSVWEAFGEAELPLIRDWIVHNLTLNGSLRYTNYSSYGGNWTYKVGALLQPIRAISLRGSYGTSYRAPALFEQFLGSTSGFQSNAFDPCNNYGVLPADSNVRANCAALGLPTNFQPTTGIQVNQVGGADAGLSAETSRAYTAGVVLSPRFGRAFGALDFSVDYFNILVENGVSQLGFNTILSACYNSLNFSDPTCAFVTRTPGSPFQLQVTTGYINVSVAKVSGWDFNLRYARDLGPGQLRLTGAVTKFDDRYSQTTPSSQIFNAPGNIGNPEWTGTFDVDYTLGRWNMRYGVEWLDAVSSSAEWANLTPAARALRDLDADDYFLHTASVRYRADRFAIVVGARNLFDAQPPFISSGTHQRVGNAPLVTNYDLLGRQFFVNFSTTF